MDVRKLIEKLAKQEENAQRKSFLAPVVRGGDVCLRIQGVVCRFSLEDRSFEGWGVFQPVSLHRVRLVEAAGKVLVRTYLRMLTPVDLILGEPAGRSRSAVLAHPAGSRVKTSGPLRVHLVEQAELFRHVIAGFDGFNFWFERVHPGRNPAQAAYLRNCLGMDRDAESIRRPGLLPQEKKLYAELLQIERLCREDPERRRLREALEHSGGRLDSFDRRGDEYRVTFLLDDGRHTSRIRAGDLTVLSAGICLSGEDRKFDLQSLVGILSEAHRTGTG